MSRNKRQGGDRNQKGKTSSAGKRPAGLPCPSCKTATLPEANYCHACGKALRGQSAHQRRDPVTVALYSIIGIAVVGTIAGLVYIANENNVAAPPTTAVNTSPADSGQSVDLSSMSPREAADRLFNRVMMAEEQGDAQEVLQFAPKAIKAYDLVGSLDADAHYHIGLVHAALGDVDKVQKQVEILKRYSPNHLLGLLLEHSAAEKTGDADAAAKVSDAFAAAYASEIQPGRPEYEAHKNSIEKFFAETAGR